MLKKFSGLARAIFGTKKFLYPTKEQVLAGKRYVVREISDEDVKELIALEREVYHGETPWTKSAFLSEIHSPIVHLYICLVHHEQIAGFIGGRVIGEDCHITNIAVKPESQGCGIGSFLIDEVEKFAIMNGCTKMSLEVRVSNRDAQRLYRRVGFESHRIRHNYYTENKEDALEMIKVLKEA